MIIKEKYTYDIHPNNLEHVLNLYGVTPQGTITIHMCFLDKYCDFMHKFNVEFGSK